jgi:hypothetical protein
MAVAGWREGETEVRGVDGEGGDSAGAGDEKWRKKRRCWYRRRSRRKRRTTTITTTTNRNGGGRACLGITRIPAQL